jgi:hypothetical protein
LNQLNPGPLMSLPLWLSCSICKLCQWKSMEMEIDRWTEIFSVGFGIACCEKLKLFQDSMKTTMELVSCWTLLNSCSFLRFQARHRVMTWHLSWRSGNHWPLLGAVTIAIREQCENVTKQPLMSSRIERTQYIYTHQISRLYYILYINIHINIYLYIYTIYIYTIYIYTIYILYIYYIYIPYNILYIIYIIYIYWESTGENRNP